VVQGLVKEWAIVNVVSGAGDGQRMGYCEHGEWCRGWSKGGLL